MVNAAGEVVFIAQKEFSQQFPKPGWVEHDASEILSTQFATLDEAVTWSRNHAFEPIGVGITNQRETIVVWEKKSGKPIAPAIVWQDRRTTEYCEHLRSSRNADYIINETGLQIDPYFSASKLAWIFKQTPGLSERARNGEILAGTIDSWLIWNLTAGGHFTEPSNASRTMLYSLHKRSWDERLLEIFSIPRASLPEVISSNGTFGVVKVGAAKDLPILAVLGDQQSALYGQGCTAIGSSKNTYGTGCFALQNIGEKPVRSSSRLLTTVAWSVNEKVTYALEGAVFIGGALVQWLRDGLGIISKSREIGELAASVPDSGGVVIVPAFSGLGAPHWDARARGLIIGITRGTTKAHIARAAEDAIAFQVADLLDAFAKDTRPSKELRVDGGGAIDDLLMQTQADVANLTVLRAKVLESTALGVAKLAFETSGVSWNRSLEGVFDRFVPNHHHSLLDQRARWSEAVSRAKGWA